MGMDPASLLASLQNKLTVNEQNMADNASKTDKNTKDTASNYKEIADVNGQFADVQKLRTGVEGQLSSLQASLDSCEDDAQRVAIEDEIGDLKNTFEEYKGQEDALSSQKADLVKTGEDLAKTGADLETESVKLNSENSEIKAEIALAEDEVAKSEMKETTETEEKPQADVQVDVPVQNNRGWQYYAELELKAQHGNDPNYKPSDSELKAKADEIKQRNIENGNVKTNGNLVIGSPQDPKYVTLNGDIDTSSLQTTDQAFVKYNQGQEKLVRESAEARTGAEADAAYAREMDQVRNFSINLGNSLNAQIKEQEAVGVKETAKPKESKYTQFYANSAEHVPEGKTLKSAVNDGDISYSEAAYGNIGGQVCSNFAGSCGMAGNSVDAWQSLATIAKKVYHHFTK